MKKIIFFWILILFAYSVFSQNQYFYYNYILKKYIDYIDTSYVDLLKKDKKIYIEYNNYLVDSVIKDYNGYKIISCNFSSLKKLLKKNKYLNIIVLSPIRLTNNEIEICLSSELVQRNKRAIMFSVGQGYLIILEYDCINNKFKIKKEAIWGI